MMKKRGDETPSAVKTRNRCGPAGASWVTCTESFPLFVPVLKSTPGQSAHTRTGQDSNLPPSVTVLVAPRVQAMGKTYSNVGPAAPERFIDTVRRRSNHPARKVTRTGP